MRSGRSCKARVAGLVAALGEGAVGGTKKIFPDTAGNTPEMADFGEMT